MMRLHRALLRSGATVAGTSTAGAASDLGFTGIFDLAAATAVAGFGNSSFGASSATRAGAGVVTSGLDWAADDGRESTGGGTSADVDGAFAGFEDCGDTIAGTLGPFGSLNFVATKKGRDANRRHRDDRERPLAGELTRTIRSALAIGADRGRRPRLGLDRRGTPGGGSGRFESARCELTLESLQHRGAGFDGVQLVRPPMLVVRGTDMFEQRRERGIQPATASKKRATP